VGCWKLDEKSGTGASDSSGRGKAKLKDFSDLLGHGTENHAIMNGSRIRFIRGVPGGGNAESANR
jgi:hypothetical protein